MIHSPEGTRSFQKFANWIRFDSKLDPRLREMVILQVGHLVGSAYEYRHHVKIGKDFGVTDRDVRCIIKRRQGAAASCRTWSGRCCARRGK
jgi:alkylhydroperoxidase family enzyme